MRDLIKNHRITGNAVKHICAMCYKENGSTEKVESRCFPASMFGTRIFFCNTHAQAILYDNKLKEYEEILLDDESLNNTSKHGGKRPGAGQPKKAPTKVISVRVLVEDYDVLKVKINEVVKDYIKLKY